MPRPARTYTPELIENGRYRYEETDEFVHLIAGDFGVSRSHFDRLVNLWGWKRRSSRPPVGVPSARRLLMKVERAADVQAQITIASEIPTSADAVEAANLPGDVPPPNPAVMAERLEREIENELRALELRRIRLASLPQSIADAQKTAQTLSSLTHTLAEVRRLRRIDVQIAGSNDGVDFDMPADIDEFRRGLARRIEAFVRSRSDEPILGPGEPPGATSS
jgi:hypothetical protein